MDSATSLARQIVLDVLYLRGPDPAANGPFRMTTAEVPVHRVVMARRFARLVPPGTGLADVPGVAATIAPLLAVDPDPFG